MGQFEILFLDVKEKFGETPEVKCVSVSDSGTTWQASIDDWHVHDGACICSPIGYGRTPKKALKHLLEDAEKHPIRRGRNCDRSCPYYIVSL